MTVATRKKLSRCAIRTYFFRIRIILILGACVLVGGFVFSYGTLRLSAQDRTPERSPNFLSSNAELIKKGRAIYLEQCVDCHGADGQGVSGAHEEPLQGIMTRFELEGYISRTMPEGDEDACKGADARAVSHFIYEQFYSLEARNRLNPPRFEFSRLTRSEHRNTVADIVSSFLGRKEERPKKFGLQGVYYGSRSMRNSKKVNVRIDSNIDFDFGTGSPDKVKGKEFSIRWSGSLLAPETGEYEIVVETANSVRLRLNGAAKPLVDANVVSGERSTYRSSIYLLGGRLYDLTIDMSRYKEKNGFIRLSWVRPSGANELIPATNFCTSRAKPLFVPATRFPPDDESYGFPRGISVSREWYDAVNRCATETAHFIVRHFDLFVPPDKDPSKRRRAAVEFCRRFAEQAFRGPVDQDVVGTYVLSQFNDPKQDIREAVRRTVVLVLTSPRFLYPGFANSSPAHELARVFWDSVPDRRLLAAATAGRLKDHSSTNRILNQVLEDQRTQTRLEAFFAHYLKLDELKGLEKDPKLFPGFDSQLVSDLKRSIRIQIRQQIGKPDFSIPDLFQLRSIFANRRIADFYGLELPKNDINHVGDLVEVTYESGGGILTHPLLMSGFAYSRTTSPIHRGVFVTQNILGRHLSSPPASFPPFDGEIAKTWTMRQKVEYQTRPDNCQRCHGLVNQLGFAFEGLDPVGRKRQLDNGQPIQDQGEYRTPDGKLVKYEGPSELARFLVESESVHRHFVEELFQFLVKQPLAAYGPETRKRLLEKFRSDRYQLRPLLIEIGKVAAFQKPAGRLATD